MRVCGYAGMRPGQYMRRQAHEAPVNSARAMADDSVEIKSGDRRPGQEGDSSDSDDLTEVSKHFIHCVSFRR